jgi:predicted PurR-regulated permease PerM
VGVITILLVLISLPLAQELQGLTNDLAINYQYISVIWQEGNQIQQAITRQLPPIDKLYEALIGQPGITALQTVSGVSSVFLTGLANLLAVVVLSIYWTADRVRFERLWLLLLPIEQRAPARAIWREIETNVGAYMRSEMIQSLLAGLLLGLGYWLMGLKYPIILALFGAFAWFIPMIGAIVALIPVLVVNFTSGVFVGAAVTCYTLGVLAVLEWVVEPRLFNSQRFSNLLIVLVMLALIDAFGIAGLLAAPPVAVAIEILFRHNLRQLPVPADKPVPPIAALQERLDHVQARIAKQEMAANSPEVTNLVGRLSKLIEEVAQVTSSEGRAESNLS